MYEHLDQLGFNLMLLIEKQNTGNTRDPKKYISCDQRGDVTDQQCLMKSRAC